ncbi:MAG: hypothetical protein WC868_05405 [Bacteroidales bacterium]
MKTFRTIILVVAFTLSLILLLGLILTTKEIVSLQIDWSSKGFVFFLFQYSHLKELFTIIIALFTVSFILFQVEHLSQTSKRTERILRNDEKAKTFEQSKLFYIKLQPPIQEIYSLIKKSSSYLLSQTWDFSDFTDQSVNEQNPMWETEYNKKSQEIQEIKDSIIRILNNFEYLSSNVLNGNIDQELSFNLFGKPFISQIKVFYPFISAYRSREMKDNEYRYAAIVELYYLWNKK